ncbi:ABC transporter permease [Romboutsia weinsteinii]|uniref:ABC transporter permease n=1 Tax=Romboutsia weinsteinii TaxID=2020949 RepID=A0A371J7R7_9FIRM|nr:ABC transporter permease [Romboutsia weinsteinii]
MIKLTFANIKRYIKSPSILLPIVLVPIVMILSVNLVTSKSDKSVYYSKIAIVLNKSGEYEKKLISKLDINDNIFNLEEKDKAINLLKSNEISAVFVLNNDFSKDISNLKKPVIDCIKVSEGGGSLWAESTIEAFINDSIKYKLDPNIDSSLITSKIIPKESDLAGGSVVSVFLICYMMYINASMLCKDLLDLRTSNVLKRMLSTKNTDLDIMFSLFLSIFLLQSAIYMFVILVTSLFVHSYISLTMVLLILANSFVSTGFIMLITRVCKDEGSISIVSMFYAVIGLGLSFSSLIPSLDVNVPFLVNLSKLTPFYWVFDAMKHDINFMNFSILILIGLVFVTAGSFRLRDFIKN